MYLFTRAIFVPGGSRPKSDGLRAKTFEEERTGSIAVIYDQSPSRRVLVSGASLQSSAILRQLFFVWEVEEEETLEKHQIYSR